MSLPSLLLLTEHFPFGNRESFLESELPILARHFDVHLLPTSVHPSERASRRAVPDNVVVAEGISRRVSYTLGNWFNLLLRKPWLLFKVLRLAIQERRGVPGSAWAIRRLIRFSIQATIVADELLGQDLPQQFDVYYSYWLSSNALSIALCKEAGRAGRFVSRAHRGDLYACLAEREYQPFRDRTIENLDRVICISEHGRDYLNTHFPIHAKKYEVSRLGVKEASVRTRAGAGEAVHIVSCSHLGPVKRVDLLLEALSMLDIAIKWTHIGGGGLESSIRQRAQNLPSNVSWHITGTVANTEVLSFFQTQTVDLFVNVSRSEGIPVSIMEAMSHGIPALATNVGGTSELVDDSNGRLLPADVDARGIARGIMWFKALSEEEKQVKRDAAWQTWSNKSDAETCYEEFAQLLLTLDGHPPK